MTDRATRTETQSIEADAPLTAIVAILVDPTRIPQWAPAFADEVRRDPCSGWQASKDGRDFTLRVATNSDAGTVDYLRQVPRAERAAPTSGQPPDPEAAASSP